MPVRLHPFRLWWLLLAAALPGCTTVPESGRTLDRPSDIPWQGFGVEWDPTWWQTASRDSGYDSTGWRLTLARLDTLGPTPVRMMLHLKWFTQDPTLKTWNWNGPNARSVLAHLDALKARDIPVLVCEWGWAARPKAGEQLFSRADDTLQAVGIARLLRELVVDRGYSNIRWYSVGNEPESEMRATAGDIAWTRLTESVQARLETAKVPLARLATEEGVRHGLSDATSRRMLRGATVAGYHSYLEAGSLESALDGQHLPDGLPLWFTEAGMAGGSTFTHPDIDHPKIGLEILSIGLAAMRRGASAVFAWTLHDGVYDFMPRSPMRWGMWAGPRTGWRLRPWARAWTLLTKAVPVGSRLRIPASIPSGIRALEIERPDGSVGLLVANQSWDTLVVPLEPVYRGTWSERRYDGRSDQGGGLLLPESDVALSDRLVLPPYTALALRRKP